MSLIKDLKNDWKKGKNIKKYHEEQKLGWNIYDQGKTIKEHTKKFYHIHYIWKYRLYLPIIRIFAKAMGRHLVKKVPDYDHNINIRLFSESVDEAVYKWAYEYMRIAYPKKQTKEWAQKFLKCYSVQTIHLMKDTLITMLLYDTAYRELFNIFSHTYAKNMATHHTKKGTTDKTGHLYFTHQDIYEVDYFLLFKEVEVNKSLALAKINPQEHAKKCGEKEEELKRL